jgi:hypothetical protein
MATTENARRQRSGLQQLFRGEVSAPTAHRPPAARRTPNRAYSAPRVSASSHADPRTTMRYDRARVSLDRHATCIVAAYLAGAPDNPTPPGGATTSPPGHEPA